MLRRGFIIGILISCSRFVFGDTPSTVDDICKDLDITWPEAADLRLSKKISLVLEIRCAFLDNLCHEQYRLYGVWPHVAADRAWAIRYYGELLPHLRRQVFAARSVQFGCQLQANLEYMQRLIEQNEKMYKRIAGNSQFFRFLIVMDFAVASKRDMQARIEIAKWLLNANLVNGQQRLSLLYNKILVLKKQVKTVAADNADLRAQMQAELESIQVQLKERMLSMM